MIHVEKLPRHRILCIDMKSFFASCAAVELGLDPLTCYLVVVSDTEREGSVILAASPKMKQEFGIRTGNRLFEVPKDPRIRIVNARMSHYLDRSLAITRLLNRFVPFECIHPYSIDESFIQLDGTERLWGPAKEAAERIRSEIYKQFGLPSAVGIGPNMLLAKLALDLEAKKKGVAEWDYADVPEKLWPVTPLSKMWGIASRLERTLNHMGILSVGQLAQYDREILEKRFGVMGTQLYYHAWGVDLSKIGAPNMERQISYGKGQVLLRDYDDKKDIQHVLLEMCEEVARRARQDRKAGRTVSLGVGYSKTDGGGFYRSKTMARSTNVTMEIYRACLDLFDTFYRGQTVRKLSVTLSNVTDDTNVQLEWFDDGYEKRRRLGYAMDRIREKYGSTSLLRAVSYTKGGTARERSKLLGGHKA
ncbi:UV damage repair protein UvrX [Tuberibacillus calidus]|uniref:Y-family DNA polymerase n=1 Tax=Tuberibacillus calidus TaxID=340097 RepID=UPI0003F8A24F|nr:UV damage repair protein UvrX [Tuberibacillus calidus]